MTETAAESIRRHLEETGALLRGHFLLSSGLHSDTYMQCARLLQWPERAAEAGRLLGDRLAAQKADLVVSPALGGLIIGHEVGRALRTRAVFTERVDNQMSLRRGFEIAAGEKVVLVEDVVTTGKSTREVVAVIERLGASVVAFASIVNRSGKPNPFDRPYEFLLPVDAPAWNAAECPLCAQGSAPIKPGSRAMATA